jgi:hypothetical protein
MENFEQQHGHQYLTTPLGFPVVSEGVEDI